MFFALEEGSTNYLQARLQAGKPDNGGARRTDRPTSNYYTQDAYPHFRQAHCQQSVKTVRSNDGLYMQALQSVFIRRAIKPGWGSKVTATKKIYLFRIDIPPNWNATSNLWFLRGKVRHPDSFPNPHMAIEFDDYDRELPRLWEGFLLLSADIDCLAN